MEKTTEKKIISMIEKRVPKLKLSIVEAKRVGKMISVEDIVIDSSVNVDGVNTSGVGTLISLDGSGLYYFENFVYYPELKSLLEKLEDLTTALQSPLGTTVVQGTPVPLVNDSTLINSATELQSTIKPLIDKLP